MARPKKSPSKVDFVLALPPDLTANDVSERAKAAGLAITPGYVYEIRSSAKRRSAKAPAAPPSPEAAFRRMVLELGTARAKTLLDDVERRLRDIIGG